MPIAVTELTKGADTDGGSVFTTASITPAANALILIFVTNDKAVSADAISSITGNGLTWVSVRTAPFTADAQYRISLFRALGASPSAGTVTINFPALQLSGTWKVLQVTGVDTTGSNGSNAVVQSATSGGTNQSGARTVTLNAFASTAHGVVAGFAGNTGVAWTEGTGYTRVGITSDDGFRALDCEYSADSDTSVDMTPSVATDWQAIAAEIAIPVATLPRPVNGNHFRGARHLYP